MDIILTLTKKNTVAGVGSGYGMEVQYDAYGPISLEFPSLLGVACGLRAIGCTRLINMWYLADCPLR